MGLILSSILLSISTTALGQDKKSIARVWNEQLLWAIRLDSARPTVHARNLYHFAVTMWDIWAAFDEGAKGVIYNGKASSADIAGARKEAMSYAAHRFLLWRFKHSPNFIQTESSANRKMTELGYHVDLDGSAANLSASAKLGILVADTVINYGLSDGANEKNGYRNEHYQPVNKSLDPTQPGNPQMQDSDRWQPLDIPNFVGQSGEQEENYPPFIGPEWGNVKPFSLTESDAVAKTREGKTYQVYLDSGPPPSLNDVDTMAEYQSSFAQVIVYSGRLDPNDGLVIDISPANRGNNSIGTNDGSGYPLNPVSNKPYDAEWVLAGDYFRVLAEFWADGPQSETPPGHWFVMLNFISDRLIDNKKFEGKGKRLDDLEWDVKAYLALGGAMHDAAIAAWSNKGWYDYPRPVSAIRYMCDQGQSSDTTLPNYHPKGMPLKLGSIELITTDSILPGQKHHHLRGEENEHIGKIAVKAWRGPDFIKDKKQDIAEVGWILCGNWWPYQRPNFVTPPFAGYVSGHSTFSRAAAEILTLITGSPFFPGGYAYFIIEKDKFLKFEKGPSKSFHLPWATYQDAADESAISRIYGGIHPSIDDIPGRKMGYFIGHQAFAKARTFFAVPQ